MAKAVKRKRSGRPDKAAKKKAPSPPKGRLLALEGASGRELERGAKRLAELWNGDEPACSKWDASNAFFELRLGKAKRHVTPARTLVLLYASDLLFRLRWEIEPALDEGRTVIAAPYVGTALALGTAAGLPADWLEELFSFAPAPDASFRVKEKSKAKEKGDDNGKGWKSADGFVEFCSRLMAVTSPDWASRNLRAATVAGLEDLERQGKLVRLGKKLPKKLGKR